MAAADAVKPPRITVGPGRLFVLSGPSGVGKDTVLRELFRRDPTLRYSVSYTTRPRRPGEIDGKSYSFLDEATFRAMAERNEFLEWSEVHGNLYGTGMQRVADAVSRNEDLVLKIDVQGAERVRRRVEGDATFIFLLPPSDEELRRRLVSRATEDEATLALRTANAVGELAEAEKFDYRIVNDEVERSVDAILEIINRRRAGSAHA